MTTAPSPTAVILAGGLGDRWTGSVQSEWIDPRLGVDRDLLNVLRFTPKVLAPVCGMPIMIHTMHAFAAHGITDFVIRLGFHGRHVRSAVEMWAPSSWQIEFQAPHVAAPLLRGVTDLLNKRQTDCFVATADGVENVDFRKMLAIHRQQGSPMTVGIGHDDVFSGTEIVSPKLVTFNLGMFHRLGDTWDGGYCSVMQNFGKGYLVDEYVNLNTLEIYHALVSDLAAGKYPWISREPRKVELVFEAGRDEARRAHNLTP